MKKNYYKQLLIKCGVITLVLICLFLPSCSTDKDESFEMPSDDVLEVIASATQVAGQYFSECSSISELEKHLDEIRNTEGVVNAYIDSQTMYVEYKELGTVIYHYPIIPSQEEQEKYLTRALGESDIYSLDTLMKQRTRTSDTNFDDKNMHYRLNESDHHSMVIYNATYADLRFDYNNKYIKEICESYRGCDFNVKLIQGTDYPCDKFFYEEIFQYDLVFLIGHGGYDSVRGIHWFITGELFNSTDVENVESLRGLSVYAVKYILETQQYRIGYNGAGIAAINETYKENGIIKNRTSYYWEISNERLSVIPNQFNERTIVYSCACKSLMGNTNFAKAFLDKGAACYLGYDNSDTVGSLAGWNFFMKLLEGFSVRTAYDHMYKEYKKDPVTGAVLRISFKHNCEEDTYVCITHPITDKEYKEDNSNVRLKGSIKIANPINNNEYGFALHTKGDNNVQLIKPFIKYNYGSSDKCKYDQNTHTLYFENSVSRNKFKDIDQFCAVLYDGERYCLGDMVDIDIEVKDSPCPDDNHPHAIDLGLPSGNLWSCCCLGSTDPSKHGGLYPWGYITPVNPNTYPVDGTPGQNADIVYYGYKYQKDRVVYHGNKYYCDSSYVYIGKDISGSEKDAVWVNTDWKGGWVMPNRSDLEELINYCSYDHNKLIGPNGSYVIPRTTWSSTLGPRNATFPQSYMCAYALSETEIYLELRNVALEIWPVYK